MSDFQNEQGMHDADSLLRSCVRHRVAELVDQGLPFFYEADPFDEEDVVNLCFESMMVFVHDLSDVLGLTRAGKLPFTFTLVEQSPTSPIAVKWDSAALPALTEILALLYEVIEVDLMAHAHALEGFVEQALGKLQVVVVPPQPVPASYYVAETFRQPVH